MNTEGKVKKPIFKRWWFWAIVVVIAIGILGQPHDSPDKDANTPSASNDASQGKADSDDKSEDKKETAKALDAEITAICLSAENDYKKFLDIAAAGTASDLDLYNAAKTVKSNLNYYNYTQLSDVKGKGIDEYKQSVSLYIFSMSEVADKAMKYIDDPVTSKLSKYQDAANSVNNYTYDVALKRLSFLADAGFTTDEITTITSTESGSNG